MNIYPSCKDHIRNGLNFPSDVVDVIKRSKSNASNHLGVIKKQFYLRPIKQPNYCQNKKRGKISSNLGIKDSNKTMCLELEASHDSGQSENYSQDNNFNTVLRENLDPTADVGNRRQNYAPDDSVMRKRRASSRNKRTSNKSTEDTANKKDDSDPSEASLPTCELCSERFQNSEALTLHLKEHNSNGNKNNRSEFECTLCKKVLSSKSSLDRHALVHTGYKPHKCGICGSPFTTNGNMNRHIRLHENEKKRKFVCNEIKTHSCSENCHRGFSDLYVYEFSTNKYPLIALEPCEKERRCPPPSSKKPKLDRSVKEQNSIESQRVYSCDRCDHCFPCQRTLVEHVNNLKLSSCSLEISKHHQHETHVSSQESNRSSSSSLASDDDEKKEIWMENGSFEVDTTLKVWKEDSFETREGKGGYIEDEKLKKTQFLKALNLRPSNDSKEKSKELAIKTSVESPQDYVFEECSNHGDLVIDESIDLTSPPPSNNGSVDLTSTASLSPSPKLSLAETNSTDLPQNMNEVSTSSNEEMEKSFDKNENPLSSFQFKLPKGKFQCKKCPESFEDEKSLKSHFRVHTQKIYECEACEYTSVDKSTLSRHMRTHSGARPFQCSICEYNFTTKPNAQRHVRKKHNKSHAESKKYVVYNTGCTENNSAENGLNENSSETTCKYCKLTFGSPRMLNHHLRSQRESCSFKPYACRKCNSGFSTKNNCTRHINKTHPDFKDKINELIIYNKPSNNEEFMQTMAIEYQNETVSNNEHANNRQGNHEIGDAVKQDVEENLRVENGESDKQISAVLENSDFNKNTNEVNHSDNDTVKNYLSDSSLSNESRTFYDRVNTNDEASALDGLMSLSKRVYFQLEPMEMPLDLSVRPIDLSSKDFKTLNGENSNNSKGFSQSIFFSREQSQEFVPVNLSLHNSSSPSPPDLQKVNFIKSPASFKHMTRNLISPPNLLASTSGNQVTLPLDYSLANKNAVQNLRTTGAKVTNQVPVADKKIIKCEYCDKTFTLKSNKERHIKNHHPQVAKPPRCRNFIPVFQEASLQKQNPNVSDVTKDKLRSVLIPKVYSSPNPSEGAIGTEGEATSSVGEKEMKLSYSNNNDSITDESLKHGGKNDFENNDLASVSSVINTANSKEINRFLQDANVTDAHSSSSIEKMLPSENGTIVAMMKGSVGAKYKPLYKCKYCNRGFTFSSARERHINTHTGAKNFPCSKCNAKFSTKSNKDRHEKNSCSKKTKYRYKSFTNPLKDSTKSHENVPSAVNLNKTVNPFFGNAGIEVSKSMDSQLNSVNSFFAQGILNNSLPSLEFANHIIKSSLHFRNLECPKQNLECKFCNNTYKNDEDLTNHMKELHPMEYRSLIGEAFNPEDTIQSWKKRKTAP